MSALDSPGSMAIGRLLERSLGLLVSIQLQGWRPAEFWKHAPLIRSIHLGKHGDFVGRISMLRPFDLLAEQLLCSFPALAFLVNPNVFI